MNEPPYYQMNRNNKRVGTSKQDTERSKQNKKEVLEQSALCPKAVTDCLYSKKKSKTNGGKRTYKKRRRKRKRKTKRKKRYKGKSRKSKKKRNTRKKRR